MGVLFWIIAWFLSGAIPSVLYWYYHEDSAEITIEDIFYIFLIGLFGLIGFIAVLCMLFRDNKNKVLFKKEDIKKKIEKSIR